MSDSDDSRVDVNTKKTREIKSVDGYYLDPVRSAEQKAEARLSHERRLDWRRERQSTANVSDRRRERQSTANTIGIPTGSRTNRFSKNSRYSSAGRLVRAGSMGPHYEPTFRMDAVKPLSQYRLDKVLRQAIVGSIERRALFRYQPKQMLNYCQSLAFEICLDLQNKRRDRYRYVVIVTIVEKQNPSVCSRMGFMWDTERDLYANFTYETATYILNGCAVGIYYE